MVTNSNFVELARKELWVVEVGVDENGDVETNVSGLDTVLDSNCRLLLRGGQPGVVPCALTTSLEAGHAAADALAAAIKERQANRPAPAREPGEDEE
jgi:succinate dehydrogenase/fumarate reductase flavoprotein subunit